MMMIPPSSSSHKLNINIKQSNSSPSFLSTLRTDQFPSNYVTSFPFAKVLLFCSLPLPEWREETSWTVQNRHFLCPFHKFGDWLASIPGLLSPAASAPSACRIRWIKSWVGHTKVVEALQKRQISISAGIRTLIVRFSCPQLVTIPTEPFEVLYV